MNIRYRLVNWTFNVDLWSEALRNARAAIGDDLPDILEVDAKTISNWIEQRYYRGFTYPNMTNMLKVCNLLDLDPRDMFELVDIE